ncbi:DUF262 domain-containing protein [Candidatus Sumerlaeota bacterium]|nr:DUF262 domain-containing protein [Candidatus Sumerlaeota bacterium]
MTTVPKIDSKDLNIADILKDFYSVPDFQREYVWKRENVDTLLDDIWDEFTDENGKIVQGPEYFIGSIVVSRGPEGVYELIDGQQRMTTCFLVLCVIRDRLREIDVSAPRTLLSQITDCRLNEETGLEEERHRLVLQYEDSDGFLDSVAKSGGLPAVGSHRDTASIRHLTEAYVTIREYLLRNFRDDRSELLKFLAAFTHRVKLIRIVTPEISHALKVFETINDRGVGLTAMDLLKNLLFMRTDQTKYEKLKGDWKTLVSVLDDAREKPLRFLRYYVVARYEVRGGKPIREDQIYEWFKNNTEQCGIDVHPLRFLAELREAARFYAMFLEGKDQQGREVRYLRNIRVLGGNSYRYHLPFLLAASHLPRDLFVEFSRHLENFIACFLIVRGQTKEIERVMIPWCKLIRQINTRTDLEAFVEQCFQDWTASRASLFMFEMNNLSENRIQKYRLKYLLAKLTQYVDEQAWGNEADTDLARYLDKSVHIEHILSQSPTAEVVEAFDKSDEVREYIPKLGNLALLERSINGSISNDAYGSKRPVYGHSKFLLTKSLAEMPRVGENTQVNRAVADLRTWEVWNSASIEERQEMLTRLALKTWNIPMTENAAAGREPEATQAIESTEAGLATPQNVLRAGIITALESLDGRGKTAKVLELVAQNLAARLTPADRQIRDCGEAVWYNNARWERQRMKDEGILRSDSPHGVWELSAARSDRSNEA